MHKNLGIDKWWVGDGKPGRGGQDRGVFGGIRGKDEGEKIQHEHFCLWQYGQHLRDDVRRQSWQGLLELEKEFSLFDP